MEKWATENQWWHQVKPWSVSHNYHTPSSKQWLSCIPEPQEMKLSIIDSGFGFPFEMIKQILTAVCVSGMVSGCSSAVSCCSEGALLPGGINLLYDPVPVLVAGCVPAFPVPFLTPWPLSPAENKTTPSPTLSLRCNPVPFLQHSGAESISRNILQHSFWVLKWQPFLLGW